MNKEMQDMKRKLHLMITKLGLPEESNESVSVPIFPVGNASSRTDALTKHNKKRKQVHCLPVDQEAGNAPLLNKLHLLSWLDGGKTVVAAADLQSKDPKEKVHCLPVGEGNWKVWVREVYNDIPLIRPTSEFTKLSDAKGCTLAWPIPFINEL